jgi:hypothetical protein
MPMTSISSFCAQHKTAAISLACCLLEVVVVWGVVAAVQATGQHPHLVRLASAAWLIGGLLSIGFSIGALIVDRHRGVGVASLAVALLSFVVCGLPMMV